VVKALCYKPGGLVVLPLLLIFTVLVLDQEEIGWGGVVWTGLALDRVP
jgi:hypothetical protein